MLSEKQERDLSKEQKQVLRAELDKRDEEYSNLLRHEQMFEQLQSHHKPQ